MCKGEEEGGLIYFDLMPNSTQNESNKKALRKVHRIFNKQYIIILDCGQFCTMVKSPKLRLTPTHTEVT